MAFTEEDKQAMDNAAVDAENNAMEDIPGDAMREVANWWKQWYMKTGHKRLARILLQYASNVHGLPYQVKEAP